ncbi:MAG: hypothetical protein KatS3mg104_0461 [Phycisphaerae bacterium]|nr:MAG: hypothetical protein KatS3mg104_0461 [Phycisphaerae bacterium]
MRRAFTLVELLVTVGILAILLALLLPALNRARQLSLRTVCLSNLRQVYQHYQLYALDFKDQVPLGYRTAKQFNSMIFSGTSTRQYVLFGWLYVHQQWKDPRIFYCPSETSPRLQFDTPENPWPPGEEGVSTANVFCGYGSRPQVLIPDDLALYPRPGFRMPRLHEFKNRAVLADLMNSPPRLDQRHRNGVNVLYGDSSARWVRRSAFNALLSTLPDPAGNPAGFVIHNPTIDAIWDVFDQN